MSETEKSEPIVKKIPVCPESHRDSIEAFLEHLLTRIDRTVNDHRALAMIDRSDRTIGQLNHFKKYQQCIRWLLSLNETRRKVERRRGN